MPPQVAEATTVGSSVFQMAHPPRTSALLDVFSSWLWFCSTYQPLPDAAAPVAQ